MCLAAASNCSRLASFSRRFRRVRAHPRFGDRCASRAIRRARPARVRPGATWTFFGEFRERCRVNVNEPRQRGNGLVARKTMGVVRVGFSASFPSSTFSSPESSSSSILLLLPSLSLFLFFNRPLSKCTEERKEVFFAVRDDKITLNLGGYIHAHVRGQRHSVVSFPLSRMRTF